MRFFSGTSGSIILPMLMVCGMLDAQEPPADEPPAALWSSRYATAHGLIQTGTRIRLGDDPTGGTYANNITAHTVRLQVLGDLDAGFEYYLQWEFTRSPGLLDARIGYRVTDLLAVDMGFFKAPMGMEFLTPTENTDFISSASLLAISPGRDAGVQLRLAIANGLELRGGVFNGSGSYQNSDNTDLMTAARLSYASVGADRTFMCGLSAATDPATPQGGNYGVVSADARYETPFLLGAAEILYRSERPRAGDPRTTSYGLYLTGGYSFTSSTGLKVRYQRLVQGTGAPEQDDLIFDLGHSPISTIGLSVECIVPIKNPAHLPVRVLTQAQLYL